MTNNNKSISDALALKAAQARIAELEDNLEILGRNMRHMIQNEAKDCHYYRLKCQELEKQLKEKA